MMSRYLGSFRIRLTILFCGLFLLIGIGISIYINQVVSARIMEDKGEAIHLLARSIAKAVATNLEEREREVVLLAQSPLYVNGALDSAEVQHSLERTKNTYAHYAWIGVASTDAVVISAADNVLLGKSVAQRPWFIKGQKQTFVGDVHEAVLLSNLLKPVNQTEPLRFIDFAAPIYDPKGQLRGVLATHALWNWVEEIVHNLLPRVAIDEGVQVFIADKNGNVLSPFDAVGKLFLPVSTASNTAYRIGKWPDAGNYLFAEVAVQPHIHSDLGWRIIVRQPLSLAQVTQTQLQQILFLFAVVSTLLFISLAYYVARGISKPVEKLAAYAQRIAHGEEGVAIEIDTTTTELRRLFHSLSEMTSTLLKRKHELTEANINLEHIVHQRTLELQAANAQLSMKAQEMEQLARRDELTQLNNRRAANEHLTQMSLLQQRHHFVYAVLLIDIDYFKKVNDTYGHDAGDQVLQHVSRLLTFSARMSDMVARFGGEEFLIVLPATNLEGAATVAEKIRSEVEKSITPCVGKVTISIGVAIGQNDDTNAMAIVHRADKALYEAKMQGRNRVVIEA